MKEEILDITKKLYHNHLTPETATNLLLRLFNVSGSFTAYDVERAYDDGYSTEGEVTFDIENYR
jgi:ribulose-5-phosphate 4-epimerase/fuculose-1-phosphate aldolase